MLDLETLNKFSIFVNVAHQQFCVWKNANNTFGKYQNKFNDESDELGCKYKNFWSITIYALRDQFLMSISRLLDKAKAEYSDDERVSLYFILDRIDNQRVLGEASAKLEKLKKFIYSNRDLRNYKFAHNSKNKNPEIQKAGMEDFFELLDWLIKEIKKEYPELSKCIYTNLERSEKLSQKGVEEVFEKLI